jgi:hypothetical protein
MNEESDDCASRDGTAQEHVIQGRGKHVEFARYSLHRRTEVVFPSGFVPANPLAVFLREFVTAVGKIVQPFNKSDQGWNKCPKEHQI